MDKEARTLYVAILIGWFFGGLWFITEFKLAETLGMPGIFVTLIVWLICIPLGLYGMLKRPSLRIRM